MKPIAGLTGRILVFAFSVPVAMLQEGPHVHDEGPHNVEFRIEKNGEVKITQDVTIGDVLVNKGKYRLTHRAEADRHILVLTRIDTKNGVEAPVREIRTTLKASATPVKRSALFAYQLADRSYRVTVVQIVGEDGDHIPESVGGA